MNPDGRGYWFDDGCFPNTVNGISIIAEVGNRKVGASKFGYVAEKNYGVLDRNGILDAMRSLHTIINGEDAYTDERDIFLLRIGIPGYELDIDKSNESAENSYRNVVNLQMELLNNSFTPVMLAAACINANAKTAVDVRNVAIALDTEMRAVISRVGADAVQPYLAAGVTLPSVIEHSVTNDIDVELALSASR